MARLRRGLGPIGRIGDQYRDLNLGTLPFSRAERANQRSQSRQASRTANSQEHGDAQVGSRGAGNVGPRAKRATDRREIDGVPGMRPGPLGSRSAGASPGTRSDRRHATA